MQFRHTMGMSHIKLPQQGIGVIVLAPEASDRLCCYCGGPTYILETRKRYLKTLDGTQQALIPVVGCRDESCPGYKKRQTTPEEMPLAPPYWTIDWKLFAWMGHRRFARHWSVPQIRAELLDTHGVWISDDAIEDYTAKYEAVVAARESDMATLIEAYRDMDYIDLTIDGLQPEKGHETLYTVRELVLKRVWFATPLLSSAASGFFRGPKGHERRINGHSHAGTRIVQRGPTLILTLDAHLRHPGPFSADELAPWRNASPPEVQRDCRHRARIMRQARSSKRRQSLLQKLEARFIAVSSRLFAT